MSCTKIQSTRSINSVIGTRRTSCGIPDVANAAAVLTSNRSAEGSSVGQPGIASRHDRSSFSAVHSIDNAGEKTEQIHHFTTEHNLTWPIRLQNHSLYVEFRQQFSEESKEDFVNLLEFAEDILHCQHVIVSFDKTRSDRAMLVKTFMFLGFHVLSPNNTLTISTDQHADQLWMVYLIDHQESSN